MTWWTGTSWPSGRGRRVAPREEAHTTFVLQKHTRTTIPPSSLHARRAPPYRRPFPGRVHIIVAPHTPASRAAVCVSRGSAPSISQPVCTFSLSEMAEVSSASAASARTLGKTGVGSKASSILQSAGERGRETPSRAGRASEATLGTGRQRPSSPLPSFPLSAEFARSELNAQRRAMRLSAKPQPEVHILGEICGGSGFGEGVPVCAKWALDTGERWELLEGAKGGQTQTDTPDPGTDTVVWSHPIDAHYVAGAMQVRSRGRCCERRLSRAWTSGEARAESAGCSPRARVVSPLITTPPSLPSPPRRAGRGCSSSAGVWTHLAGSRWRGTASCTSPRARASTSCPARRGGPSARRRRSGRPSSSGARRASSRRRCSTRRRRSATAW